MPDLITQVGKRVRAIRELKKLNPNQLAKLARTTAPTIASLEAGQDTRISILSRVADALGCTVGHLLGEREDDTSAAPLIEKTPTLAEVMTYLREMEGQIQPKVAAKILSRHEAKLRQSAENVDRDPASLLGDIVIRLAALKKDELWSIKGALDALDIVRARPQGDQLGEDHK